MGEEIVQDGDELLLRLGSPLEAMKVLEDEQVGLRANPLLQRPHLSGRRRGVELRREIVGRQDEHRRPRRTGQSFTDSLPREMRLPASGRAENRDEWGLGDEGIDQPQASSVRHLVLGEDQI